MNKSKSYARKVVAGKILANKYIKLACLRFLDDLESDLWVWDQKAVDDVNYFFSEIIFVPELGEPVDIPEPHAFWIEQLYGFKHKDGRRRFNKAYVQVARKNFKTFYAAALTLYELIAGPDKFPMIMQGANSRDQALICTDMTGKLIKASPEFKEYLENGWIRLFTYKEKTIEISFNYDGRNGRVEAMPQKPGDGGNPSVGIVDEFHEAKSTFLLETIESGQGQRLNPLRVVITSPGHDKDGPCYTEIRESCVKMLEGHSEDDSNLACIWELDNEDEWDKIEMMEKSNPMIPYSPTLLPFLERRIKEAKQQGGSKAVNIKIKNCGLWVDAPEIWIESNFIEACMIDKDILDLYGGEAYVGFDLAKGTDLNALSIMVDNDVISYYWIPESKLDDDSDGVDYRRWHEQGYIFTHEGNVIDMIQLGEEISEILSNFNVQSIGFDSRYAYMGVVPVLAKAGYEEVLVPVGQGFNLSPATIQVETWVKQQKIRFLRNPILSWNFRNSVLKRGTKDDVYPTKVNDKQKIDGVISLCNAVEEYLRLTSTIQSDIYIGGI